jgi:putative drug exporter of the RND superfamily
MHKVLQAVTDRVTTKKGVWITLAVWLIAVVLLALFAPGAKDYEVSQVDSLPGEAQAVIAQKKLDQYFRQDGTPAIFVFQSKHGELKAETLLELLKKIEGADLKGLKSAVPLQNLPPQAMMGFFSDDKTTAVLPYMFDESLETKEIKEVRDQVLETVGNHPEIQLYVTGPAGIAADTLDLFSRADLVLLFSTIGLILVLLIVIYRSPLLALIPLIAAAFVYEAVMQILGLMGKAGLVYSNQTVSIMSILLFATITDYSLFVFSRFREELKVHEDKFAAMKAAMRGTGMPVFFSGGTVLAAMLVLFFAQFGDYRNFAPTFSTAMAVVMLASVTLIPALFAAFGRKAFWPKVPRVGEANIKNNAVWSRIGHTVVKKPGVFVAAIGIFLLLSASYLTNLNYEFDTMKSFPEDMPSRQGYEVLEQKFAKGDLAPTTVLLEAEEKVTKTQMDSLQQTLEKQPLVSQVRPNGTDESGKVVRFQLTFDENPYAVKTMDAMEQIVNHSGQILKESGLKGNLYFAGETANKVDDRIINNRDTWLIVLLETILIFLLLIVLTRSFKMPVYMMGTILISFLAALGLGMLLTKWFFGIDSISNRVPLYSFVFLVALGIDYNIMLMSRFQEERKKHPVKQAVENAVASTGGVISSAGVILAATFAVLMTQPMQLLFVFGFIVAVGILLDTFLIRGMLLPGMIALFEKDKASKKMEEKEKEPASTAGLLDKA